VALAQNALGGFTRDGEGLVQDLVRGFAARQTILELCVFIRSSSSLRAAYFGLERVDLRTRTGSP
jgi:hypothetical protein